MTPSSDVATLSSTSCQDGLMQTVQNIVQCDRDPYDYTNWTPLEKAVFHGHIDTARILASNPSSIPEASLSSESRQVLGHERPVAVQERMIILTFGATQKNRQVPIFEPEPSSATHTSTSYRLLITHGNGADQSISVSSHAEFIATPVTFRAHGDGPVHIRLTVETEGGDALGSGVLLLGADHERFGTDRESLLRDQQVLLYRRGDMAYVGRLTVSTLVIRPYTGALPARTAREHFHEQIEIVGHRGILIDM